MTVGERIKKVREKTGMSQVDFADKINVSKQTLYKYENNLITNIPSDKIEAVAKAGGVSPAYLMGWEEMDFRSFGTELNMVIANNITKQLELHNRTQLDLAEYMGVSQATVSNWCKGIKIPRMTKIDMICNYFDIKRSDLMNNKSEQVTRSICKGVPIPVYGRVAAGIPLEMIEDVIDTEEISEEMAHTGEFFGLRIKGDSMAPDICNGDTVIVRRQEDAETGDIVIATINGDEATCKRLRKYKEGIELISVNPSYNAFEFSNEEILEKPVKILGKVVESRRKF